MREKPLLQDDKIVAGLLSGYGLSIVEIEFLPIGNEPTSWLFKVCTDNGNDYFLKVKNTSVYEPSTLLPKYLKDSGIEQIIAPLPTLNNKLYEKVNGYTLTLYPFIDGDSGKAIGLSNSQWEEFGNVLGRIHSTKLPDDILKHMERETFLPRWSGVAQRRDSLNQLNATLRENSFNDPYLAELASFWKVESNRILNLFCRSEELSNIAQDLLYEPVLCHSDIHPANILIDRKGGLFIIDWDTPILAPRERDLMFVIGVRSKGYVTGPREEGNFFKGYGQTEIDPVMLVYYRYEWAVQDIGSYCSVVFSNDFADDERQSAVQSIITMFESGSSVELANDSEKLLSPLYRSS